MIEGWLGRTLAPLALAAACASNAEGAFVGFVVCATTVSSGGQNLTVYSVFARFNGATDTVLSTSNLRSVNSTTISPADAGGF